MSKFDKSVTLLFLTIAAPQQIARLREIIRSARDEKLLRTYALTDEISLTVRLQMILDLDQKSTTAQLVRKYHIVALFKACGGDAVRSITGFVNTTSNNFPQQERSFGNPANIEYANVASVMMREIYPDLEVGQLGYEAKLKRIKKLRKLGKRLHILTEKFGCGLLGLMISLGMDDNCVEGAQPDDV
jgi:archaellum biogenesis protein FlaJ (TadC family)